jgi:hypothetical protein
MRWCSLSKSCAVRLLLALCCAALPVLAACTDSVVAPPIDCDDAIGAIFVELTPPGSTSDRFYMVNVGDSLQISASLRRVDASDAVFNPQQGWSCSTAASSPVAGTVSFSTLDTRSCGSEQADGYAVSRLEQRR